MARNAGQGSRLRLRRLLLVAAAPVIAAGGAGAAGAALPACSCGDSARATKITVTGSSTVAPLVAEIGKRFEAARPGVRVDVQAGGSARGIADARSGLADIGMVSRALKDDERDLRPVAIARDGVCLIVHRDNPVAALTDEQVVAIYTGRATRWSEVGGRDAPITVVNKAEGRSTLELFLHHFKLRTTDVRAQVVIGDNEQGIKTVAGNPDAIGYVSVGTAEVDARAGVPIKLLAVGGVAASTESVARGAFPLSRPLHLVTRAAPEGLVKELLDFASSPAVHDLVRAQAFVPLAR